MSYLDKVELGVKEILKDCVDMQFENCGEMKNTLFLH